MPARALEVAAIAGMGVGGSTMDRAGALESDRWGSKTGLSPFPACDLQLCC